MRPKTNKQTKPTSLALPRPGNPLLDELTAQVSIDQASRGSLGGIHKTIVTDAVLARKLCQGFGFEDTQKSLSRFKDYSLYTYISRELSARIVRFFADWRRSFTTRGIFNREREKNERRSSRNVTSPSPARCLPRSVGRRRRRRPSARP